MPGTTSLKPDDLRTLARKGGAFLADDAVDRGAIARAFDAAESFFALPIAQRMAIAAEPNGGVRGYRPLPDGPGDLKEWFFATFGVAEDPAMETPLPGGNLFPAEVPELREALAAAASTMHAAGVRVLRELALAVGVPADTFASLAGGGLRVLRYPELDPQPRFPQIGAAEHTDMTPFALIVDDAPGLQCWIDDAWVPMKNEPGAAVCVPGELLTRWTGDAVRPNRHRVELTARRRLSLCYFMLPELATEIVPVRTTLDAPYREHPPLTFAAYMLSHSDAVRSAESPPD